jgi:hypothetical protein
MARLTPGQNARRAVGAAGSWIEAAGRVGYAAKGIVYALVGVLAVKAAVGAGGATEGRKEVLHRVADGPLGEVLLVAIGVGLLGYALWRVLSAILDPEHAGSDSKGMVKRGGYLVSGIIHAGLALSAFRALAGTPEQGSEAATRGWTARLLEQPFGPVLVGLVGVAILGAAAAQLVRAYRASFLHKMRSQDMSAAVRRWAERLGRLGYAARGVVFAMVGGFLMIAALQASPNEARGLGGALDTLARQPYGPFLLGLVALGLLAYGVFAIFESRYRRMTMS